MLIEENRSGSAVKKLLVVTAAAFGGAMVATLATRALAPSPALEASSVAAEKMEPFKVETTPTEKMGGGGYGDDRGGGGRGGLPQLTPEMNDKLEEWVSAKRRRDFDTSDRLSAEMKDAGFNPEEYYRPEYAGGGGRYNDRNDDRGGGGRYDDRGGGGRYDDRGRDDRDDDWRGGGDPYRQRSYSPDRRLDDRRRNDRY